MRGRRAVAYLVDTAPLWLAIMLVGPLTFLWSLFRLKEEASGFGLFDPSRGDSFEARELFWPARASVAALALVLGLAIVQSVAIALGQRTIGMTLLRLRLMSGSGPSEARRVFLRETLRFVVLASIPLAHTLIARPVPAPAAADFYAPSGVPSADTTKLWVTLVVLGGLALVAVALTIWDAIVVARNPYAKTLGDRLADTRIAPRGS